MKRIWGFFSATHNNNNDLNNLINQNTIADNELNAAQAELNVTEANLRAQTEITNDSTRRLNNLKQEIDLKNQLATQKVITQSELEKLAKLEAKETAQNQEYDELFEFMALAQEKTNEYSRVEGVRLNNSSMLIDKLPASELFRNTAAKEAFKARCIKDFDEIIDKIKDNNININTQDPDGKTFLMYALSSGFTYAVDKLLSMNADVNILDKQGSNALHYAASMPHTKSIMRIIDQIDNINLKSPGFVNQVPLHILIRNTNTIYFSDEINDGIRNGQAFITSSVYGDIVVSKELKILNIGGTRDDGYSNNQNKILRIIDYFIDHGANINVQNDQGQTPFFIACLYRLKYVADRLITNYSDKIDFTIKANDGNTILHYAASLNNIDLAKFIINKKICSVNDLNKDGYTPLISAIACLNKDMVEYLLSKGADINKCDNNQASPLYHSLGYNNNFDINIVKCLIDHGADVNKPMFDGDTPMHMVGYKANIAAMKMLITKGANINVVNLDCKTPLHVLMDRTEISSDSKLIAVKFFLSYKARVDIVDNQGHTSIDLAKQHFPQAVQWLEHPEIVPSTNQLELSYANDIINYKLPIIGTNPNLLETSSNNNNNIQINKVTDLNYDNKLLNNFDLLIKAAKVGNFKVSEALNSSFNLNSDLVNQVINDGDCELLLAGLISIH